MKFTDKQEFEKVNKFGTGAPNTAYAKFFIGDSFLNPLTDLKTGLFAANVTFEPGCRNNWHIHHATSGGGVRAPRPTRKTRTSESSHSQKNSQHTKKTALTDGFLLFYPRVNAPTMIFATRQTAARTAYSAACARQDFAFGSSCRFSCSLRPQIMP